MTHVMLSIDTVIKAANAALNKELDPSDLEGLSALTRVNLIAALAKVAQQQSPPATTMAITPEDFALLSSEWETARHAQKPAPVLPRPKLVTTTPTP